MDAPSVATPRMVLKKFSKYEASRSPGWGGFGASDGFESAMVALDVGESGWNRPTLRVGDGCSKSKQQPAGEAQRWTLGARCYKTRSLASRKELEMRWIGYTFHTCHFSAQPRIRVAGTVAGFLISIPKLVVFCRFLTGIDLLHSPLSIFGTAPGRSPSP